MLTVKRVHVYFCRVSNNLASNLAHETNYPLTEKKHI